MPPVPASEQPAAEVDIDAGLVRRLLDEQHPDLASLDLELVAAGWDNVMFRLGRDFAVRLPRRQVAVPLIEHEQRWLPELAKRLPVPIPAPVRVGVAGCGYPWPWSVCPWLPGTMAATAVLDELGVADDLARFLTALSTPAPADAPANPVRGVPLQERDESMRTRLAQVAELVDVVAVRAEWDRALRVQEWQGPPMWLHGDLHPANLLVERGRLSAVIDFGDITAGDPATDLLVAWTVLGPGARQRLRVAVDADEATWRRGRGWALLHGVACVSSSADNELIAAIGRRTVAEVLADVD